MLDNKKICLFIIFFGFCLALFNSINNTKKNDYFFTNYNNEKTHNIIKGDVNHYWSEANIIKENFDKDKSISSFSRPLIRNYLYPKIIALYYLMIDQNIKDPNNDYKIGNYKVGIPIIQSIFFFLCLTYFFFKIKKRFSKLQIILIISFLSLNPILSQYHSSYWTESIFLSMLLILFANLIDLPKKKLNFFLLGILVGLIYLQRTPALYLFFPIIIYFFIIFKFKALKINFIFILGFSLILILIGLESYKRANIFYFTTFSQSHAPYHYVSYKLNANKLGISKKESMQNRNKLIQKFIDENNINFQDEKDLIKLGQFKKKYFLESLKGNFIFFSKYHLYKTLQALVLNKDAVYLYWENQNKFWETQEFKNKFKADIVISSFFYLVCFLGLFQLYKYRNKDFNRIILFTTLFVAYNITTLGWMGIPRYMIGNQIFFSIFFSFGVERIYNYFIKFK